MTEYQRKMEVMKQQQEMYQKAAEAKRQAAAANAQKPIGLMQQQLMVQSCGVLWFV